MPRFDDGLIATLAGDGFVVAGLFEGGQDFDLPEGVQFRRASARGTLDSKRIHFK